MVRLTPSGTLGAPTQIERGGTLRVGWHRRRILPSVQRWDSDPGTSSGNKEEVRYHTQRGGGSSVLTTFIALSNTCTFTLMDKSRCNRLHLIIWSQLFRPPFNGVKQISEEQRASGGSWFTPRMTSFSGSDRQEHKCYPSQLRLRRTLFFRTPYTSAYSYFVVTPLRRRNFRISQTPRSWDPKDVKDRTVHKVCLPESLS